MEKYRLSSYTIFSELYNENKTMLIHGYTGAIDIVDESISNYLRLNRTELFKLDFPFSDLTWEKLKIRGYITSMKDEEEIQRVKRMAYLIHRKNKIYFKHFGFLVSYDCNFRCPYCYENNISRNGDNWSKKKFTVELVDKAFDAMLKIEEKKELHSKIILLYGGEPFLKENKEIVKYILEKGVSMGYKFSAISNGYDIEEYQDIVSSENLLSIQISIDGNKELHDKRRIHYETGKSFDKIISNIKILLKKKIRVSIRINTDEKTFDDLNDLKKLFQEQGFTQNIYFNLYIGLLFSPKDKTLQDKEDEMIFIKRKKFNKKYSMSKHNIQFEDGGAYQKVYLSIKNRTHIKFDSDYCSSQHGTYLFDPCGNIYGCLESVGNENVKIGSYIPLNYTEEIKTWHERNVGILTKCSKCKYLFLCRGGCFNKILKRGGKKNDHQCDDYPNTLKSAVNRAYTDFKANENR